MDDTINPYPPCFLPIGELNKTTFSELIINTYYKGTIVFVKLLTIPIPGIPLISAGEDENGSTRRLQFYNQSFFEDPKTLFPEGRVIALKEPFYKSSPDGYDYIRVDHPSNIMILRETADIIPPSLRLHVDDSIISAEDWKSGGNEAVVAEEHFEAINCYSQALLAIRSAEDEKMRAVILRNRAQIFLKLGFYDDAKIDALNSLNSEPGHVKALYRAAMACYSLGQFDECRDYLQQLLNVEPTEPNGLQEMNRVRARLGERESGHYDFTHMTKSVDAGHQDLDHANFTKRVAVRDSEKHGRGLFTTEAVKAGEILLVEKAFSTVTRDENKHQSNTNDPLPGRNAVLLSELVQKAYRTPSLLRGLLQLYAGPNPQADTREELVDGRPVFDTFRLVDIITYNCFGFLRRSSDEALVGKKTTDHKMRHATGVWLTASYTNHSCSYNAMRAFIGDMMIIRATRDLAAGDEVSFTYVGADEAVLARRNRLRDAWGFECECALCVLETQSLPVFERKREELLGRIKHMSYAAADELTDANVVAIRNMAHQMENLYDKALFGPGQPRTQLAAVLVDVAGLYAARGSLPDIKLYSRKAMEYLGFGIEVGDDGVMRVDRSNGIARGCCVTACIHLASTYESKAVMLQAVGLAKHFYKICFGEDDSFAAHYADQLPPEAFEVMGSG